MRVIAGELGGRTIEAPRGSSIRPTTDRIREAVFNTLFSMGALEGARVLDLFAGTGALGIEALSRGAAQCTFVDRDPEAVRLTRANVEALGLSDRSEVLQADAVDVAASRAGSTDLALADPPYGFDRLTELAMAVEADLFVVESGGAVELGDRWRVVKDRSYGTTVVAYARRVTDA